MSSKFSNKLVVNQGFTIFRIYGCSHENVQKKTKGIIHICLVDQVKSIASGARVKTQITASRKVPDSLINLLKTL